MDSIDLQKIAKHTRSMREIGITLILASGVLTLFLFIPQDVPAKSEPAAVVLLANVTTTTTSAFANTPLEAKASIVYDLTTGKTLYAKNANDQLPLASLTKLLTVYAAVSELSPDTPITIPKDIVGLSYPYAFSPGQVFSLKDLARLTLTASLNDGATAIAQAVATREHITKSQMLTNTARSLDLSQTYALNGNGLDINSMISGGYGSARDIARLAGALADKAPQIVSATTHSYARATSTNGLLFTVKNTDPIINTIPHLLLSKTGYTDLAGGNLALVFDVGIEHYIAIVVLGSSIKGRFTDGATLVAATFASFANIPSL